MPPSSEMTPIHVRVDYDFASSLCYVAHRVMQRMEPELAPLHLILDGSPVDLVAITGWSRGAVADPAQRARIHQIAEAFGVPLRMPTRWLDSRPLHAVALGIAPEQRPLWRERAFTAIYEEGILPDADEAARLARSVGIACDDEVLFTAEARLQDLTQRARAQRVTGVPNFMLGDWAFGGIQTEDTMRKMLTRYVTKRRQGKVK